MPLISYISMHPHTFDPVCRGYILFRTVSRRLPIYRFGIQYDSRMGQGWVFQLFNDNS